MVVHMTNRTVTAMADLWLSRQLRFLSRKKGRKKPPVPSMATTSIPIHTAQNPRFLLLLRPRSSTFLRGTAPTITTSHVPLRSNSACPAPLSPSAKFNLSEIMGGRGLCNGERGVLNELQRSPEQPPPPPAPLSSSSSSAPPPSAAGVADDAFEKELSGLTGGFPGGEKGLKKFIERNPPPPKEGAAGEEELAVLLAGSKPKPPELPLFLPGMIVIVKNPKNPFYMYSGIVQRVTDGKAGVLFEGGNWDKLLTFDLIELERREKGPPMVNPKSAVLEDIVQKKD